MQARPVSIRMIRTAAFLAGIILFIPTAPIAEFYVYQRLVIPGEINQTVQNIGANRGLFIGGIYCFLFTYIVDILLAWALYVLLLPSHKLTSMLVAWIRLIYAALAMSTVALLFQVVRLIDTGFQVTDESSLFYEQIDSTLQLYKDTSMMSFTVFAIYLVALGVLVYRARYIPKFLGVLLVIAGVGYFLTSLQPFLYPDVDLDFLMYTYFGELIFTIWLLFRGTGLTDEKIYGGA